MKLRRGREDVKSVEIRDPHVVSERSSMRESAVLPKQAILSEWESTGKPDLDRRDRARFPRRLVRVEPAVFRAVFGVDFLADLVRLDENNTFSTPCSDARVRSSVERLKERRKTRGELDG